MRAVRFELALVLDTNGDMIELPEQRQVNGSTRGLPLPEALRAPLLMLREQAARGQDAISKDGRKPGKVCPEGEFL